LEGEKSPAGRHPTGGFLNDTIVPEDAGKGWYTRLRLNCCCQQVLHIIQEGRARVITSSMHPYLVGSSYVCPPVHQQIQTAMFATHIQTQSTQGKAMRP
jgi:hypothetical protein